MAVIILICRVPVSYVRLKKVAPNQKKIEVASKFIGLCYAYIAKTSNQINDQKYKLWLRSIYIE